MQYDLSKLKRIVDRVAGSVPLITAFTEILDYALLPFRYFETREERNEAYGKLNSYRYLAELTAFLSEVANLNPGFCDPVGEFHEQEISRGRLSKYFTGESITMLLAHLVKADPKELDGKSFYDPDCGSGRTMLALAKGNRNMSFFCADADPVCCKMTLFNMLLNSLTGEVAYMDSLTYEFRWGYKVLTMLKDGFHYPYYLEFTDPEESTIARQPIPKSTEPVVVQGNLFNIR